MDITSHGIHILPGESAAGTWLEAFGAEDRLLVDRDDLTCGPIRAFERLSDWTALRQGFWDAVSPQRAKEVFRTSYDDNIETDAPRTAARLRDASAIYLWAGNNLRDQLSLIFSSHMLERAGADPGKVYRVPFEVRPHHYGQYISVGSSSIDELKTHPAPIRATQEHLRAWQAAWKAITSQTPAPLENFLDMGMPAAPHILSNLLQRYPRCETGLSLWDHMLLERVGTSGPDAAYVVAEVLCDTWDNGDGVGECYLFYRLEQMANPQLPKPLLTFTGNRDNCRGAEVTLTSFGREVLGGHVSAYPVNPIDEWIGGVRLSSRDDNVWMYEGDILRKSSGT